MRNVLALIGAAVVLFAGLGWYLGWYKFALEPGANGNQRIQIDLDTNKIADDARTFGDTVGKAVDGAREKADGSKPADFVGPPAPPDLPARQAVTQPTRRN